MSQFYDEKLNPAPMGVGAQRPNADLLKVQAKIIKEQGQKIDSMRTQVFALENLIKLHSKQENDFRYQLKLYLNNKGRIRGWVR